MRPYFGKMDGMGKALRPAQVERMKVSVEEAEAIMREIDAEGERIRNVGIPVDVVHKRGEMTVWERIEYLVDPGTFCPLHTIYAPEGEESGSTGVVDGVARIGVMVLLIGPTTSDSWGVDSGSGDNNDRVTDLARSMNLPLLWFVNCSGLKLPDREVYANRRDRDLFFRHRSWRGGIPVFRGYTETNPAGGGIRGSARR